MSIARFRSGVNLKRLKPVVDPFTCRGTNAHRTRTNCRTACPRCGGERLWFIDPKTTRAELVCIDCVAWEPNADAPEAEAADIPFAVQLCRPSCQHVYRIVRDHDGKSELHRYETFAEYTRRVDQWAGVATVAHALQFLRDAGFIRKGVNGWEVCARKGGAAC